MGDIVFLGLTEDQIAGVLAVIVASAIVYLTNAE